MLEFGDSVYYLDIKAFEKAVSAITTSNQSVLNIEEKETSPPRRFTPTKK